ncbi:hypothetical protein NIES2101_23950 [Calothrix sp. HK-06]|nr:hypothetical protein NIES2101_23815 [Calothrix sp. HK-06]OKH47321.1 hypothetical protein NIES2101_23950 [Calothrix sp. HK-06]
MELMCFPLLHSRSKRLIQKRIKTKRAGTTIYYKYRPKQELIERLSEELRMSQKQIRKQIKSERLFLLQEIYGSEVKIWQI